MPRDDSSATVKPVLYLRADRARIAVAVALLVGVGSAAAQSCVFRTPLPSVIDFGPPLAQSLANTRTGSTTADIQCTAGAQSPTWIFTGMNGNNPLRLRHAAGNATIAYSVLASYITGGVGNQSWRISATILGPAYENVPAGAYSDALTVTILP